MIKTEISFKVLYAEILHTISTHSREYVSLMTLLKDRIYPQDFGECGGVGFFRSVSYYHLSFGMDTAFCRTMNHSEKQMVVTISDYQRLLGLMEFDSWKSRDPEIADRLILSRAF